MNWRKLPIEQPYYGNLPEPMLETAAAALENRWVNQAGGHSAFPRLRPWKKLAGGGDVYLKAVGNELLAVTSRGSVFTIDRQGFVKNRTGAERITVKNRPTFAKHPDGWLIAAGGPLVSLGTSSTRLVETAPECSHIGYCQGWLLALEAETNIIRYNDGAAIDEWPDENFFTAESKPDEMTALMVSDRNEILIAGPETIELFEVYASGQRPFYLRSSMGEGLFARDTLCETPGAGLWCVNSQREFIQLSQVGGRLVSEPVDLLLQGIDDWTGAWAQPLNVIGQRFLLLSAPKATSPYGVEGMTFLYDYRAKRWSTLYAWNDADALQARWPVHSVATTSWGAFAGGEAGAVYQLVAEQPNTLKQRDLFRSAMYPATSIIRGADQIYVNNLRIRVTTPRLGAGQAAPRIEVRARLDGTDWMEPQAIDVDPDSSQWFEFGSLGMGGALQLEYRTFDGARVEVQRIEADIVPT